MALVSPQPKTDTVYNYVYSPDVDPTSEQFDTEDDPQFKGEPTTVVDLLNACMKDEMARDSRILVFGEDVADASREAVLQDVKGRRRRVQGDLGAATDVRRGPRVQHATRGSQHPGARHRTVHAGLEARGGDPVLRLHLARVPPDPERDGDHALALEQRVQVPGGGARDLRRVPEGRLDLPLADRRGGLYLRSRPPGHLPIYGPRRQRPPAPRHPVRRSRAVPRAQASRTARRTTKRPTPARTSCPVPFGKARVARGRAPT